MGGAVSSGRDNDELTDNLMGGKYIRTKVVERVFRALDRADYMTPESRDQAYKDLAWRNGALHLSAPCIYSEVMEGLELKPGLSFLNVGSGTGYLSTMVGLVIGAGGINHGIEVHPLVVDYAVTKNGQFIENSAILDDFDFCEPRYYSGNGLCLSPQQSPYDRVYCGAGCPAEYLNYFKQLIKVGGILVMPLNDSLVQIRRDSKEEWTTRNLLNVSFASLRIPTKDESTNVIKLEDQCPPRLQVLCRSEIRRCMRLTMLKRHPELRQIPQRPKPPSNCPRRICIPIEDDTDIEGLNALHDLDRANGANEMNALLSLVLSMGQNRVAGALRFDTFDSPSDSSDEEDGNNHGGGGDDGDDNDDDDDDDGDDGDGDYHEGGGASLSDEAPSAGEGGGATKRQCRGLLTFELQHSTRDDVDSAETSASSPLDVSSNGQDDASSSPKKDEPPKMPAEVEILLGKEASSSHTTMDWEETEKVHHSTDEDADSLFEDRRVVLDSGLGEGNTPSDASPLDQTETKSDESGVEAGLDSPADETEHNDVTGRRRLQKRSRGHMSERSTSTERETDETSDAEAAAYAQSKRRAGPPATASARRLRLSKAMKRGVKELPLPYALKKYVNYGRCFQF